MAPFLDLEHLADALKGFVRPSREGREVIQNLVVVGIKEKKAGEVRIQALCVRATKVHDEPVKIEVSINTNKNVKVEDKIISISCTCDAGSSKEHVCKHGMATLMYLERNDESSIEVLTCTDVEQRWGGLKESTLSKFDPVPLKDFCHISTQRPPFRREIKDVSAEMSSRFLSLLLEDHPESEAAVFLREERHNPAPTEDGALEDHTANSSPFISTVIQSALTSVSFILRRAADLGRELYMLCSQEEQTYFDSFVKLGDDAPLNVCLSTTGQDNDLWDKYRFGRITGSVSYQLYTYSSNKNPAWDKKLKSIFESEFKGNENTNNGLIFEKDAKEKYEASTGNKIVPVGIFIHPLVPWFGYSADGIIQTDGECVRLWENKTPKCGKLNDASSIFKKAKCMDKQENLKQKHQYYGQIQLGMLLYSLPICDFTLYSMGFDQVAIKSVAFNEKFCLQYVEMLTTTYFKVILPWLSSKEFSSVAA